MEAMTPEQHEVQRILSNVADLPIGKCLTLAMRYTGDGLGGMIVKRSRRNTWVFQREFYIGRSRWADGLAQCLEEIEHYVKTGRLQEPDRVLAG